MSKRNRPKRKGAVTSTPRAPAKPGEPKVSTRDKLFGTGRRIAVTVASIFVTAVIGWAVAFYAPGLVTPKTEHPPIATDVQDDPFGVSTFNSLSVRMFLPASVISARAKNPPINYCDGFHDWGRGLGGADANETYVRLIAQGETDSAVIITGISARILDRKTVSGVNVECPSEGGAQIRVLAINLDSPDRAASYLVKGRLSPFGFTLKKGETEVFDISAKTSSLEMTDWDLVLHVTVDGNEQSIEVQDRGRPFRTTAQHGGNWYTWSGAWGVYGSPFGRRPN
jgi:hypothetical protein